MPNKETKVYLFKTNGPGGDMEEKRTQLQDDLNNGFVMEGSESSADMIIFAVSKIHAMPGASKSPLSL